MTELYRCTITRKFYVSRHSILVTDASAGNSWKIHPFLQLLVCCDGIAATQKSPWVSRKTWLGSRKFYQSRSGKCVRNPSSCISKRQHNFSWKASWCSSRKSSAMVFNIKIPVKKCQQIFFAYQFGMRGRQKQTKIDSSPHNMSYSSQQVGNEIFLFFISPPVAVWRIKRKHSRIFKAEHKKLVTVKQQIMRFSLFFSLLLKSLRGKKQQERQTEWSRNDILIYLLCLNTWACRLSESLPLSKAFSESLNFEGKCPEQGRYKCIGLRNYPTLNPASFFTGRTFCPSFCASNSVHYPVPCCFENFSFVQKHLLCKNHRNSIFKTICQENLYIFFAEKL